MPMHSRPYCTHAGWGPSVMTTTAPLHRVTPGLSTHTRAPKKESRSPIVSYDLALEISKRGIIVTTVRTRKPLRARNLICMIDRCWLRRIMFGTPEVVVRRAGVERMRVRLTA